MCIRDRAATEFYVDLHQNFGPDTADATFPQCLELMESGGVAMWFDSTEAARVLNTGALAGNLGVERAPTGPTDLPGGGLWSWGFAIPAGSENSEAGWEFIRWATSQEFIELVGEEEGWENAPGGIRLSTYDNPEFQAANEAYADVALAELLAADPNNPGTTSRPGLNGVQYVGIPEFVHVATDCSAEFAAAVNGAITIDEALNTCQDIVSEVSQPAPGSRSVPLVEGLNLGDAVQRIGGRFAISVSYVDENGNPIEIEGQIVEAEVISQDPPFRRFVDTGSEIELVAEVIEVPDVLGLNLVEAIDIIREGDLTTFSPTDPDGNILRGPERTANTFVVIAQELPGGSFAGRDTEIDLVARLAEE